MEEFLEKVEMFFELRQKIDVNIELLDMMRKNLFEDAESVGLEGEEKKEMLQSIRERSIHCIDKDRFIFKFYQQKSKVNIYKTG